MFKEIIVKSDNKLTVYNKEDLDEIIKKRIPEEIDFPKVILIDSISYCNLKCAMCPHKNIKRKKGIMSWDLYKKIIEEIAENMPNAQIWITFFGEGMILKDLPERIKHARDKGLGNIILNSNGNLFKTDYSRKLIEAGLNGLYLGVDAIKPETHAKLRVGGDLEKVTKGILEYKRMLDEFGKEDQRVVVQFVEMESNKDELKDFVKFWHEEHDIQCKIRPMISWAGRVEANNLKTMDDRLPCYWGMNTISITDQGFVTYCTDDMDCDIPMGDINNQTIKEVWTTTLRKCRNYQRQKEWEKLPEMCRNCNDWQSGYARYM
jgi:radical SAM protein with 4Fe4S-binding SPASM domain